MLFTFFNYQLYTVSFLMTSIYRRITGILKILSIVELLKLKPLSKNNKITLY